MKQIQPNVGRGADTKTLSLLIIRIDFVPFKK